MNTRKKLMYVFLAAGLFCLFLSLRSHRRSERIRKEGLKTAAAITQILKAQPGKAFPLKPEDHDGPLYEAQKAYLSLNFRHEPTDTFDSSLVTLAACIRAPDVGLNMECKNFARVLLSDWVFSRPESSWHSRPEVDAFFRVLKESRYRGLENSLRNRPLDFESKYLSQI